MQHKLVVVGHVKSQKSNMKLEEGVDYYIEKESGLMVLTSFYLKKRGFCCANRCTNCPYDPPQIQKGNSKLKEDS